MRRWTVVVGVCALLASALIALAGCGGGDEDGGSGGATGDTGAAGSAGGATGAGEATGATGTGAGGDGSQGAGKAERSSVEIKMKEFAFVPKVVSVAAGSVTIKAPNVGSAAHELLLVRTDADPGSFKAEGGKVNEDDLPGESVGEIADVPPGETKQKVFELEPGRYAMICNLPGHYQSGMYGSLTAG